MKLHPSSRNCAARVMRILLFVVSAWIFTSSSVMAEDHGSKIDIQAREYILVDHQTGAVLATHNPDKKMPPSSMSKLMTTYMVFDALKSGRLSLTDEFRVSARAWKQGGAASGGSTMFLNPGKLVKVEDLLRGVIVQSGNDACIVLAEGLAGSEAAFAEEMNARAKTLGLTNSYFVNATGLPDENHYMTSRDLAILARRIIDDFQEYYPLYSERYFTFNNITQGNRNPLLYRLGSGGDGLKTGYTEAAGYGLTGSAVRNGRRLISVANGMKSIRDRDEESSKLIDWGFREFTNRSLFEAGEVISEAEVWLGQESTVPLSIASDVTITIPRVAARSFKAKVVYEGPVLAPIKGGDAIGKVVITAKDMDAIEVPVVATQSIGRLGFIGRLWAAAVYILFGPPAPPDQAAGPNATL